MNKKSLVLMLLLLIANRYPLTADVTTGASFLKIGVGARAIGLGSAFTAIADDVTAMYWNPGGLNQVKQMEVSAMYSQWIADSNLSFIGYALPLFGNDSPDSVRRATLGFSVVSLSQGNFEGRDENRQLTSSFGASDLAVTASYSKELKILGRELGVGVNTKIIQERLEAETATGLAFDVGLKYNFINSPFMTGFAVQNLGPQMKFISEGYNLPLSASFGLGYTRGYMTVALDIKRQIYEGKNIISLGTEFSPFKTLSLRGGYVANLVNNSAQGGQADNSPMGFGGGLGINLLGTSLDYAFVPYGILGDTHRLSVSLKF